MAESVDRAAIESLIICRRQKKSPQACLSLSIWNVSLSAGPSFRPMYFIMVSLRSNNRALPSISCSRGEEKGHWLIYEGMENTWLSWGFPINVHVFWKGQRGGQAKGQYLWWTAWHHLLSRSWGLCHQALGFPGHCLWKHTTRLWYFNALNLWPAAHN